MEMTDAGLLAKATIWAATSKQCADGSKARRLGFHEYIDTEQMFYDLFDELKNKKIIP